MSINPVTEQGSDAYLPRRDVTGHPRIAAAYLAVTSFLVMGLLLPLGVVSWIGADLGAPSLWVAVAVVIYSALRLALLIGRGEAELLAAGFWIFSYVFMGLALLGQIATRQFPEPRSYTETTLLVSALTILGGLVAFDFGQVLARFSPVTSSRSKWTGHTISLGRPILLGTVGITFVAMALLRYGIDPFFTSRNAVDYALQGREAVSATYIKQGDKAAGQLFQNAVKLPVFVAAYMLLLLVKQGRHKVMTPASQLSLWGFLLVLIAANVVVNNPISSGRFSAGLVLIAFASIYVRFDRKATFRVAMVGLLAIFLFAFSALDAFRRTEIRNFSRGGSVGEVMTSNLDYGTTQVAHETSLYVQVNGHTMGRQLLGVVLSWVPRRFWPEKPVPTGSLVNRGYVVVSSSLWTEGFIDFGLLGSLVYLGFYGWGVSRLDKRFLNDPSLAFQATMPLLVGFQFFILRGSLLNSVAPLVLLLSMAFFCYTRASAARIGATPDP